MMITSSDDNEKLGIALRSERSLPQGMRREKFDESCRICQSGQVRSVPVHVLRWKGMSLRKS